MQNIIIWQEIPDTYLYHIYATHDHPILSNKGLVFYSSMIGGFSLRPEKVTSVDSYQSCTADAEWLPERHFEDDAEELSHS